MKNRLVIYSKYGGLGDHLFFSALPRIAKLTDPNCLVYVSNQSNFRSTQIREIVWELNPYIDGFVDEGGCKPLPSIRKEPSDNILSACCKDFGFECGSQLEPEVYYKPKRLPEYEHRTLVDLNYKSFVGAFSKNLVNSILKKYDNAIFVNPPKWLRLKPNIVTCRNLSEYCDLINSCQLFVCFTSGGATLAAALNKRAICLYGLGQSKMFHHSALHEYMNVGLPLFPGILVAIFLKIRNTIRSRFEYVKVGPSVKTISN